MADTNRRIMKSVHCGACGASISEDDRFCRYCGAVISKYDQNTYSEHVERKIDEARIKEAEYEYRAKLEETKRHKREAHLKVFQMLFLPGMMLLIFLIFHLFIFRW